MAPNDGVALGGLSAHRRSGSSGDCHKIVPDCLGSGSVTLQRPCDTRRPVGRWPKDTPPRLKSWLGPVGDSSSLLFTSSPRALTTPKFRGGRYTLKDRSIYNSARLLPMAPLLRRGQLLFGSHPSRGQDKEGVSAESLGHFFSSSMKTHAPPNAGAS